MPNSPECEHAAAGQAGAQLIRDEITTREKTDGGIRLTGRTGRSWTADQVALKDRDGRRLNGS